MTRRKIRLAWIGNDTSRKASFKKRRTGLVKKVRELSTLCGVSAFIVIYGPGESDPPVVWPSVSEARALYDRFRSVPDIERCKKMVNQESYLRERATKMAEQLKKQHRKNKEKMTAHIMRQVIGQGKPLSQFETSELSSVVWVLEEKMKEIKRRIEYYDQTVGNQPPGSSFLLPPPLIPMEEGLLVSTPGDHSVSWESLFAGIMNNSNSGSSSTSTNANNNNSMIVRSSGVDQGNSVGVQVPDHHQLFLGGTSHGSTSSLGTTTNNNNNVQPYFVAGSSSSSSGNGQLGFQPYGSSHFGHGNNIIINHNNNNNNVASNNQMGLGNLGYLGSGGGNHFIINGFDDMGLAAHQVINHGGSSSSSQGILGNLIASTSNTLDLQSPNFGHNVGSGGVGEDLGLGVQSGNEGNMGENNNDFGTNNNFPFALGQAEENNQGSQSDHGRRTNHVIGSDIEKITSVNLFGASGGTSEGAAGLSYDFSKNWPGLFSSSTP